MTTIAYKDRVISYDSLMTAGSRICDRDFNKCIKKDGVVFFLCGTVADNDKFIDIWFGKAPYEEIDISAFVYEGASLFEVHCAAERMLTTQVDLMKAESIGSGSDHALTAMDLGLTAKEAVKMAALRDTNTGGRIRTFNLKP